MTRPAHPAAATGRTGGPVERHTVTLPVTAVSVNLARRTAQMAFTTWGLPADSTVDAALLITTELVANAVRHARRAAHLDLTVSLGQGELSVAVHDEDPGLPPWPPTATTPGGLRVLANLIHDLGGTLTLQPAFAAGGKTIRATLPAPANRPSSTQK